MPQDQIIRYFILAVYGFGYPLRTQNAVKVIAHVLSLVAFWHDEMWLSNVEYSCFLPVKVYDKA